MGGNDLVAVELTDAAVDVVPAASQPPLPAEPALTEIPDHQQGLETARQPLVFEPNDEPPYQESFTPAALDAPDASHLDRQSGDDDLG